jgi:hypothetical protein
MGHAITQAVNSRPSNIVTHVQARIRSCEMCGEHIGIGALFL